MNETVSIHGFTVELKREPLTENGGDTISATWANVGRQYEAQINVPHSLADWEAEIEIVARVKFYIEQLGGVQERRV